MFVELKKKYQSMVYKRRISFSEEEAIQWVTNHQHCPKDTQISAEVDYFLKIYKTLHPTVFLSYKREAYYAKDKADFRVTFDDAIFFSQEDFYA